MSSVSINKSSVIDICRIKGLSSLEAEIMKIVWDRSPIAVREVYEITLKKDIENNNKSHLSYTTVMSIMMALADKDLLRQEKTAKKYVYKAIVDRKQLSKSAILPVAEKLLDAATGTVYKLLSDEKNVSISGVKKLLNDIK